MSRSKCVISVPIEQIFTISQIFFSQCGKCSRPNRCIRGCREASAVRRQRHADRDLRERQLNLPLSRLHNLEKKIGRRRGSRILLLVDARPDASSLRRVRGTTLNRYCWVVVFYATGVLENRESALGVVSRVRNASLCLGEKCETFFSLPSFSLISSAPSPRRREFIFDTLSISRCFGCRLDIRDYLG